MKIKRENLHFHFKSQNFLLGRIHKYFASTSADNISRIRLRKNQYHFLNLGLIMNFDFQDLNRRIDSFRLPHESVEHWSLRKEFLVRNYSNPIFSIEPERIRLLSLSQVFGNTEFLGCVYPKETMELVAQLSQGITAKYRETKKSRLQRTFVKASDAAERKFGGSTTSTHKGTVSDNINKTLVQNEPGEIYGEGKPEAKRARLQNQLSVKVNPDELILVQLKYVLDENPLQILNRSCTMCHISYEMKLEQEIRPRYTIKIGNFYQLSAAGSTKDEAKANVASQALEELRQKVFTLEIKQRFCEEEPIVQRTEVESLDQKKIPTKKDDNFGIANRMMKLMGWSGGALGKNEDGIEIPISVSEPITRTRLGLGHHDRTTMASKISDFITEKIKEHDEIAFSSEFTKTEREIIHNVARKLNLKSRSHGKEGLNRQIIVFQKVGIHNLVQQILDSGETNKYRVIYPDKDKS